MKPSCHVCNTKSNFLLEKDGFDLYKCPECKLVFVYPQLDEKFLAQKFYSKESGYQSNRAEDLSFLKENKRATIVLNKF